MTFRTLVTAALALVASVALAQGTSTSSPSGAPVAPAVTPAAPAPAATPAPSPASSTISGIRNKVSAADLPSAESILEVYRERHGEDGGYLVALGWLSRGALLLDEVGRAAELNAELRRLCDERLARGPGLGMDDTLETALGAAIEVEAQLRARTQGGRDDAVRWLRGQIEKLPGRVAFRSRLYKRLDMMTLAGAPAPELAIEDWVGAKPATLAARRGRPVVLFIWRHNCGDCLSQAAALGRAVTKYAGSGLEVVPLTRYYEDDHVREKAAVDSVWTAVYGSLAPATTVISTESMIRYGGSSTPTFVFIDRKGVVRWYTPTRLTEAQLEHAIEDLLR